MQLSLTCTYYSVAETDDVGRKMQCDASIIEIKIVCIVKLSLTCYSVAETDEV